MIEAHLVMSTARKIVARTVWEGRGCRSGYRGGYLAGSTENIRPVVAEMRRAISSQKFCMFLYEGFV